jgi:hypothetical protein
MSQKVDPMIAVCRGTEREMDFGCVYPETNKGKGFASKFVVGDILAQGFVESLRSGNDQFPTSAMWAPHDLKSRELDV